MSWNYRVIEFEDDGYPTRVMHEVYYDGDKLNGYGAIAAVIWSTNEDADTPKKILKLMAEALDKPVLKESDFK